MSQVDDRRSNNLRDSPMMAHLLDALQAGTDIGHFGRLTFAMIARYFLPEDELVTLLANQSRTKRRPEPSCSRSKAMTITRPNASESSLGKPSRTFRSAQRPMTPTAAMSTASSGSPTRSTSGLVTTGKKMPRPRRTTRRPVMSS